MTWEEIEERLNQHLYERLDGTICMKLGNKDYMLHLCNIIYLCKKCYEANS
jgi:hypothetical protein